MNGLDNPDNKPFMSNQKRKKDRQTSHASYTKETSFATAYINKVTMKKRPFSSYNWNNVK